MADTKKKKGKWKRIVIILLVLAAVVVFLRRRGEQASAIQYKEETASVGDVEVTYSFTGEITAPNTQSIKADKAGTVREIFVQPNQPVGKGQRLMRMEDGATYKADIAGEVIALPVRRGDYVESGRLLTTVADLGRMQVEISIDEYDVDAIEINMPVSVYVTALDRTIAGRISGLNKQADTTGQIAYYTAVVDLDADSGILPGMQVEAVLVKNAARNVVRIHAQALQFTETNEAYVLVSDGHGAQTMRAVDTGLTDGIMVEIRDGLTSGETVYYLDQDTSFEDLMRAFGGGRRMRNQ